MIPFEFRHDLWRQKIRVMGLSCGVVCVILRLAVLIQYRSVTDTQTDRQTDRQTDTQTHRHTTTAYTALSKASRGKNMKGDEKCKQKLGCFDFLFYFNRNYTSILYRFYRVRLC